MNVPGKFDKIFVGLVSSSDAVTYTTQVQAFGPNMKSPMQGIPLAGVFASTIGFKESVQYSPGQAVLCYAFSYTHCYIIGAIPDSDVKGLEFPSRACLKTADGTFDEQNRTGYGKDASKMATFNQNRPTDVVEGEYVLGNEFGVLLGLFQTLSVLKASELAQVQCYVLDDLVRIVSHNYEHLHSMGELKIFHDGKALMAEYGSTHDPREALGVAQVEGANDQAVFNVQSTPSNGGTDQIDFYEFTGSFDPRTKAIERLKLFLGKLGDMVHMFITRPDPAAVRALNGVLGGNFDTGMADVQMGLDGRISVRTVTGASIEKTNWIMVPQRVRTAEDPMGDQVDDITFADKDPFTFDDSKTFRDNPTLYFLQMRDCNAYLQDFYNYKNFLQYTKDFQLSKGSQNKENQLSDISAVDPYTKVNLDQYTLRRSGFYLMDNGGIMLKDAWGSALIMEGGDIYIQAAKDQVNQPLRNYITKAGQFINIAARKDVDISSTEEGFRLKTDGVQYFYSDKQGIILESNAPNSTPPEPNGQAYTEMGGIVLLAQQTGIYSYGMTILDRAVNDAVYKAGKLLFEATNDNIQMRTTNDIIITADDDISLVGKSDMNIISINGGINILAQGELNMGGTSTNLGNQGSVIGMVPAPGSEFACQYNGVLPVAALANTIGQAELETNEVVDFQIYASPFNPDSVFTNMQFRFLDSDVYNLDDTEDHIPQTIAQQDDVAFGLLNLDGWNENPVNGTYPFPGADKFDTYYTTCALINLQNIENDIFSNDTESLQSTGSTLTDSSLNGYKVLP